MVTFWHSCFGILFRMSAAKIKMSANVLPLMSFLFMFAESIVPDTQRAKDLISKTCLRKLWMSLYQLSCLSLSLTSYSGLYPVFGFVLLCGCCFIIVFFRLSSDLVHHWVCKGVEEVWCTLQEVKLSVVWTDGNLLWKSMCFWEQEDWKWFWDLAVNICNFTYLL